MLGRKHQELVETEDACLEMQTAETVSSQVEQLLQHRDMVLLMTQVLKSLKDLYLSFLEEQFILNMSAGRHFVSSSLAVFPVLLIFSPFATFQGN